MARLSKRAFGLVAAATLVAATLTACSSGDNGGEATGSQSGTSGQSSSSASGDGGDTGSAEPSDGTALVTAWPSAESTLDPANATSSQDRELAYNVYQRLVDYKFAPGDDNSLVWQGLDPEAQLAKSWDFDGSSIVFHLRDDVKFYPSGNPLTADDVVWSLTRPLEAGQGADLQQGGVQRADLIEAVDEHTVKVNLEDPSGKPIEASNINLAAFRMPNYGIVDSKVGKEHATDSDPYALDWFKNNVAGSGPYYVASRSAGEEIQLAAVPDGIVKPAYDKVTIRIVQGSDMLSLVRSGTVNVAHYGVSAKNASDAAAAGLGVVHANTPDFVFMEIPTDSGIFADKNVRQAVEYAIPYDDIINTVYLGSAVRALSYVNANAPDYSPAWSMYSTDIEKAKSLMGSQSGLTTTLQYSNADSTFESIAVMIKGALAEIGIDVTLVPKTPADIVDTMLARAAAKDGDTLSSPDLIMYNMAVFLDDASSGTNIFAVTNGPLNYGRFSDPLVDSTQAEYQFLPPSPERKAAYEKTQQLSAEDAFFVPLVTSGRTVITTPGISDVSFSPEPALRYWLLKPGS